MPNLPNKGRFGALSCERRILLIAAPLLTPMGKISCEAPGAKGAGLQYLWRHSPV